MKLLTKNYIEDFTTITVSTGNGTKANAYDRDPATKWASVGSDDTTTETYEVVWGSNKTFDRVSLMNHNLKDFDIEYWSGGAYVAFSPAISVTGGSATDNLWEVTEVTTTKIKISATKTIAANAEKYVGEFLAYNEYFDLPTDELADNEDYKSHYREFEHELADGGIVLVTEATIGKYRNVFSFNHLAKTYRDYFYALKDLHLSFWLIPDDDDVSKQYFCNMTDIKFDKVMAFSGGEQAYRGFVEIKET